MQKYFNRLIDRNMLLFKNNRRFKQVPQGNKSDEDWKLRRFFYLCFWCYSKLYQIDSTQIDTTRLNERLNIWNDMMHQF
jgi:hypothetical protein